MASSSRCSSSTNSFTSSFTAAIFSAHSCRRLSFARASAKAAAAKILVYSAVTEFPMRRRLLLAAVAARDVIPGALVLRQGTHRQVDCVGATRDHRLCIIVAFLSGAHSDKAYGGRVNVNGGVSPAQWRLKRAQAKIVDGESRTPAMARCMRISYSSRKKGEGHDANNANSQVLEEMWTSHCYVSRLFYHYLPF